MKPHPLLLASLLLALVAPTGCTSLSRMSQVAMDHSLPIGPPNRVTAPLSSTNSRGFCLADKPIVSDGHATCGARALPTWTQE
ncbi:hypothetical protein BIKONL_003395 [Pseudomonas putida]